nr:transposase [Rhabdothermincola sediminis]
MGAGRAHPPGLVPEIWLPTPEVRAERERARWRLHLVRHRVALKNRIRSTLLAFGKPCVVSNLFGPGGRELLDRFEFPDPWASNLTAALALIGDLSDQIGECERDLRRLGADHPYVPTLMTTPGIAWVLGYTIASEIGGIERFASPKKKLVAYTGLLPEGLPVRRLRSPGTARQERPQVLAAGLHLGRHPCRPQSPAGKMNSSLCAGIPWRSRR